MEFTKYKDAIVIFDKYPQNEVVQPTAYFEGLAGECGEICAVLAKEQQEGFRREQLIDNLINEMGDYMWYWTRLGVKINIPITEIFNDCVEYIAFEYNRINPSQSQLSFVHQTCRVVEQHKKVLRDDNGVFTEAKIDRITQCMRLALIHLFQIMREWRIHPTDVLTVNVDKLSKRLKSNTIHGSDDDGSRDNPKDTI